MKRVEIIAGAREPKGVFTSKGKIFRPTRVTLPPEEADALIARSFAIERPLRRKRQKALEPLTVELPDNDT